MKDQQSFLMISGHDYRSPRKANVHFIMRELAKLGHVRFFSLGFSRFSKIKKDPRLSLWDQANKVAVHEGVECYLWRSFLHPVNLRRAQLSFIEDLWFKSYANSAPKILDQWIKEATTIIIESGMGIILFEKIKKLNPDVKIIYRASDMLETIGCSGYLQKELQRGTPHFDKIALVSAKMSVEFPEHTKVSVIPHGLDIEILKSNVPSPYPAGTHLVSVGSMLFDASFFEIASAAFPDITFHVIGAGQKAEALKTLPNVKVYDEMPFEDTLPYLKHAQAGIAPYEGDKVAPYLVDTSLKLMQFGALGLPAICPYVAAGNRPGRFGYEPGNKDSITAAINAALECGDFEREPVLSWEEVAQKILQTR